MASLLGPMCLVLFAAACGEAPGSPTSGASGAPPSLDDILDALRADLQGTLAAHAATAGWPLALQDGYLFVSTDPALDRLAGDPTDWVPAVMHADQGFRWLVVQATAGDRYKLTDGNSWAADPWSRSYTYDDFGEISLISPADPHLDRYFGVAGSSAAARTIRVWVPSAPPARVLYVHDGQNLFDPQAIGGGWHLQGSAPDAMLIVAVDNTTARIDEYTHVQDIIDGMVAGGGGDAYAAYLQDAVRPLIRDHYGEVGPIGTMGSSLGGLISFHIADRYPDEYAFAASLSGTMGWGKIQAANETLIERYQGRGHRPIVLYLDSGGSGTCYDSDNDSILDDDPNATDNYCENAQMRDVLQAVGYSLDADLFYVWEPDAPHDETAWAARVWKPLQIFSAL